MHVIIFAYYFGPNKLMPQGAIVTDSTQPPARLAKDFLSQRKAICMEEDSMLAEMALKNYVLGCTVNIAKSMCRRADKITFMVDADADFSKDKLEQFHKYTEGKQLDSEVVGNVKYVTFANKSNQCDFDLNCDGRPTFAHEMENLAFANPDPRDFVYAVCMKNDGTISVRVDSGNPVKVTCTQLEVEE